MQHLSHLFHFYLAQLTCFYIPTYIESAPITYPDRVPALSAAQQRALLVFEEVSASKVTRLDMELRVGDLQMLHNHQVCVCVCQCVHIFVVEHHIMCVCVVTFVAAMNMS